MSIMLRAFIVGYTGETGKALIKVLAKDQRYGSVKLIGRRETTVDYGDDAEAASKKFSQHTVDFDKLDEHQLVFSETDVGFCALGTTFKKSGQAQMRVIDHDYIIKVAELALASGCKEFHVVSTKGANPNSSTFYLRLKGETEKDLRSTCIFPNYVAVYRPGVLLCDRVESRPGERFLRAILKPMAYVTPDWMTTKIEVLAKAMANAPFCLSSMMRKRAAKGDDFDSKYFLVETNMIPTLAADTDEQAADTK